MVKKFFGMFEGGEVGFFLFDFVLKSFDWDKEVGLIKLVLFLGKIDLLEFKFWYGRFLLLMWFWSIWIVCCIFFDVVLFFDIVR